MDKKSPAPIGGGDFEPTPEGQQIVVCVDGIDMGYKVEEYQGRTKLVEKYTLIFESEHTREDGKRFIIAREFSWSMGEKANLRKFVGQFRGKPLTDSEAATFDITTLLGKSGIGNVVHKISQAGRKYGILESVVPLFRGVQGIEPSADYERPEYLMERKAEYAKAAAEFAAKSSTPSNAAPVDLTQPPAALADMNDDGLPF